MLLMMMMMMILTNSVILHCWCVWHLCLCMWFNNASQRNPPQVQFSDVNVFRSWSRWHRRRGFSEKLQQRELTVSLPPSTTQLCEIKLLTTHNMINYFFTTITNMIPGSLRLRWSNNRRSKPRPLPLGSVPGGPRLPPGPDRAKEPLLLAHLVAAKLPCPQAGA